MPKFLTYFPYLVDQFADMRDFFDAMAARPDVDEHMTHNNMLIWKLPSEEPKWLSDLAQQYSVAPFSENIASSAYRLFFVNFGHDGSMSPKMSTAMCISAD